MPSHKSLTCPRHPCRGIDLARWLERLGFQHVGSHGSHAKYRHPAVPGRYVVVILHDELATGTYYAFLRRVAPILRCLPER
jgi:predicted RNA binding protein YcfA (HicA-like mRNA interferase family)